MKHTALYERHIALGAKTAEFAGWQMPIRYPGGTLQEHRCVREAVGIFDVSHMGRIVIRGPQAEELLDYLSTNHIAGMAIGKAVYTVWPYETGTCVDDLLVYRQGPQDFFVVVNAGNREKDLLHLQKYAAKYDVVVEPRYEQDGILALQGPKAPDIMEQLFPEAASLKPFRLTTYDLEGQEVTVARTGYTGEKGYEMIARNAVIPVLWDRCFELGAPFGIEAIGLGARDTLRLEMGYALYGHELTDEIGPDESVSAWTVRGDKEFVGKAAMQARSTTRHAAGVVLDEAGVPREGYRVFDGERPIGIVTSGNQSPSLGKSIALVLLDEPMEEGRQLQIEIRKRRVPATVVALPFLKSVAKQKS